MTAPYPFELGVLIGRFQPFHQGHERILQEALNQAENVVVVLGSSFQARDAKDPFTWQERAAMITACLSPQDQARIRFAPVRDYYDDELWVQATTRAVAELSGPAKRIALFGYLKDASSYYLNRFAHWALRSLDRHEDIDATTVRQLLFECESNAALNALLQGLVPSTIRHYLIGWKALPEYARLCEEHAAVAQSKQRWGCGPFITVDAVVRAAEHVLLIRRGRAPGKDLWAIPGGFLDMRERLQAGAIRELREETGLSILGSELEAALKDVAVFDHPDRGSRGRTVTHAHFFDLKVSRLPQVEGADDAASATWIPISELAAMEDRFFEDHFHILNRFFSIAE